MFEIEKIIPGGYGLATNEEGKKVFLWNALPGETVEEFKVTKKKSHYLEAIATKISSPSPSRVEPKDTCFLSTSPWQIMSYDYELEQKQSLVVEIFRQQKIPLPLPEIITDGKEYFYRNKMEYSLYWDHQTSSIKLAFHERGSHRKIPISSSSLEKPEIFRSAQKIIDELNSRHEEARKYQSLILRANQSGEISGGLYVDHEKHPVFPVLEDKILSHSYSYSPNGFFQINLPVYEQALLEIKKHIYTDEVLDLYAGVGTIGLSVARDKKLTLVETDRSIFSELEKNCSDQNFPGQTPKPILSKSELALDFINDRQTVIVDPPRAGCDPKLINRLLEVKPKTIIYLSCNPATQARDIAALLPTYKIKAIKTFNFFPRTPHIENLIVLNL